MFFCNFSNAFCGCSLRRCTLYILLFIMIFQAFSILRQFSANEASADTKSAYKEMFKHILETAGLNAEEADKESDNCMALLEDLSKYLLVKNIILIFITAACLYGAYLKQPALMIPYMLFGLIFMLIFLAFLIILLISIWLFPPAILAFLFAALFYSLIYYKYLIIYNYYKELKEEKCNPRIIKYMI